MKIFYLVWSIASSTKTAKRNQASKTHPPALESGSHQTHQFEAPLIKDSGSRCLKTFAFHNQNHYAEKLTSGSARETGDSCHPPSGSLSLQIPFECPKAWLVAQGGANRQVDRKANTHQKAS